MARDDKWSRYEPMFKSVPKKEPELGHRRYEISLDEGGKPQIRYPWGQILPADGAEVWFWKLSEIIRGFLDPEVVLAYGREKGLSEDTIEALRDHGKAILESADDRSTEIEKEYDAKFFPESEEPLTPPRMADDDLSSDA